MGHTRTLYGLYNIETGKYVWITASGFEFIYGLTGCTWLNIGDLDDISVAYRSNNDNPESKWSLVGGLLRTNINMLVVPLIFDMGCDIRVEFINSFRIWEW